MIGADMDGQKLSETDLTGATALVIGAEGEGISRLVKDECDLTVALAHARPHRFAQRVGGGGRADVRRAYRAWGLK